LKINSKKNININKAKNFGSSKTYEFNYDESMNFASLKKNPFSGAYSKDSSSSSRKNNK
jgi:hypothetical protein